ncbi:ribosomal protein S18-alanine N-acetyltransferase [Petroclostridium sp. X23]|uniref:ribosomal protein S18-alanine N-acetyltransferase n=1 Tax=Petroclostridium sp. X23 TaxID=3045146 RepID=UPI0024ACEDDD|nr:ribosomal protein S18-alanine N-acetyltransferase [Petroclostridium sp. X23]WHH57538.1 ribosomal protein S18-alanine N-acetyltransferase [Petroclostridium sp. X23]
MQMKIMPMDGQDIDSVMEIEHLSFSIPWTKHSFEQEIAGNKHAIYVVAKCDEKVVGYGGMWKVIDEGHITNIAVHPEYRRMKVASTILEALILIAKNEKIESLTLEVRDSNIPAQILYTGYGFKVVGRRKGYYADNNEDALLMTLEI